MAPRTALLRVLAAAALAAVAVAQCPADPLAPGMHRFEIDSDGITRCVERARDLRARRRFLVLTPGRLCAHAPPGADAASEFLVYVPTSYNNTATPLFVNFHGYLDNMDNFNELSGVDIVRRGAAAAAAARPLTCPPPARLVLAPPPTGTLRQVAQEQGYIGVIPQGYATSWNGGECCGAAARNDLDDVAFTRRMVAYVQTRVCVEPTLIFAGGFSNGNFFTYRLACTASDLVRHGGGPRPRRAHG